MGSLLVAGVSGQCATDLDCELNGECIAGQCQCDTEWQGPTCGRLHLGTGKIVYGGPDTDYTSWGGGPPTYDHATGRWAFFVTEIADHCGLSEWKVRSTIVKASGDSPAGPFTRDSDVVGVQGHNPYYIRDQLTGKHVVFHIGSGREGASTPARTDCVGGTTPAPALDSASQSQSVQRESSKVSARLSKALRTESALLAEEPTAKEAATGFKGFPEPGGPGAGRPRADAHGPPKRGAPFERRRATGNATLALEGVSAPVVDGGSAPTQGGASSATPGMQYVVAPQMHVSDSPDGPWAYMQAAVPRDNPTIASGADIGASADNPAPFMFSNGSVLMLSRSYDMEAKLSRVWVSVAPGLGGPYRIVQPAGIFSPSSFSEEDPCLWMDHRGRFHALFHFTHGHAYSEDGLYWHWGSENAWSGDLHGMALGDSERPRVWINQDTKRPELLFFASGGAQVPTAVGQGQKGMTLVRPIGEEGMRKWGAGHPAAAAAATVEPPSVPAPPPATATLASPPAAAASPPVAVAAATSRRSA